MFTTEVLFCLKKQKQKENKKVLWRNPQLRSYILTSRALEQSVLFQRCDFVPRCFSPSLISRKHKQKNKVGVECLWCSTPRTLRTVTGAGEAFRLQPWSFGVFFFFFPANQSSVDHLIDCSFLVSRSRDDELVVRGDVAAENRRRLLRLKRTRRRD